MSSTIVPPAAAPSLDGDALLSVVVDTAVDGIIIIDGAGVVQVFNPACEALFGYRAAEVIGQNIKMLMPQPYHGEHDDYLANYRKTGVRKIIGIGREVVGLRKNGTTFPMELSVGEGMRGEAPMFVGIIRDITDRKRAETSAREREARLNAVIDTAVDGIIIIDGTATVQVFNRACEALFGYRAAEVIGQNVKMLMPDPYHAEHDAYVANYRKTGVRKIIGIGREVVGLRKNGTTFPMELSVGEVVSGDAPVFVGIIRDITERKRAEAALREREARLRSIFETLTDAVVIIDEHGLIELFSPAAERLFGYSMGEVMGRNVAMLMPSPYHERHDGYLEHYRDTGEKRIIGTGRVVVALRKDGTTFPMELSVGEMKTEERRMFIGFIRDITERQGTERRLQEIQAELMHNSRLSTMGQMASALAHELNQPLTAVINYAQASRRLLGAGAGEDKLRPVLDKAVEQAGRAGQIIRRLRDFLEKGETERRLEDINKVVEEATALGLVGVKDTGVKVQLEIGRDMPSVMMDKIQIQQVVMNLVRNAVEAMEGAARRELVIATTLNKDDQVEVAVLDTGPGLAPEVAAQLFQPFVSTKQKGMGLGLSICRTIVEAHGGRLGAAARDGGGTAFRFTLPRAEDPDDA
ncbi:MAG TPA: PAS domain S-box protein [Candidatus Sulfotelmatobacter sp.]|nr:PAS domain S-box protein [Candidatus Sulfotelmatobacter sp.]